MIEKDKYRMNSMLLDLIVQHILDNNLSPTLEEIYKTFDKSSLKLMYSNTVSIKDRLDELMTMGILTQRKLRFLPGVTVTKRFGAKNNKLSKNDIIKYTTYHLDNIFNVQNIQRNTCKTHYLDDFIAIKFNIYNLHNTDEFEDSSSVILVNKSYFKKDIKFDTLNDRNNFEKSFSKLLINIKRHFVYHDVVLFPIPSLAEICKNLSNPNFYGVNASIEKMDLLYKHTEIDKSNYFIYDRIVYDDYAQKNKRLTLLMDNGLIEYIEHLYSYMETYNIPSIYTNDTLEKEINETKKILNRLEEKLNKLKG